MPPSNRNLYLAAAVSCLTAGLFGYAVGHIGGVLVLKSFLSSFSLSHVSSHDLASARSICVTAWIVGAFIGVPIALPISSKLGRQWCLQLSAVLYIIGACFQTFSSGNLPLFDLGRLLSGMGVGAGTLVSPIYISEISTPGTRGFLMSGYQVFLQSAALLGFWIAFISQATISDRSPLQWQMPVALQLLTGLILLLGTFIIPESPRYLAQREQHRAMKRSLSWLRRRDPNDPELIAELSGIQSAAELSHKIQRRSFANELKKKDVRRRLIVGVGLMVFQNMVGLNALNYYCPVIFMSAGFTSVSSSLFLAGIFGLVKVVSSLAFMFKFVYVKGNRFWLLLGSMICGVTMLVLAYCVRITTQAQRSGLAPSTSLTGIFSILMVYIFTFAFGVSLGPISWNVCAEIFPLRINTSCCAITTCTQWAFQIIIAAITPPLLASVGWATYIIYAAFCFASVIWVAIYVPETRGLGVGKPMDELFGAEDIAETESIIEVSETTALLEHDRRRRSSVRAYI